VHWALKDCCSLGAASTVFAVWWSSLDGIMRVGAMVLIIIIIKLPN
jgi:hypothetical protein